MIHIDSLQNSLQTASHIDSFIDLFIIDEKGENVFNPKYQRERNLVVLILKGKKFINLFNPKSFAPKGYVVNPDYSVRLFLNFPKEGLTYSFTYIKFNENNPITIKTEFKITSPELTNQIIFGGGSIAKEKIWFNSDVIWESYSGTKVPCVNIAKF